MPKQLANGVWLNVIKTSQFKTISMTVDFLEPGQVTALSKRILLAQLLETSSAQFPTQTALASKLSMMYGANYGVNVFRYGLVSGLRFSSTIINDHFIGGQSLLKEMVDFLRTVIYEPLTENQGFEPVTFKRQQQNLVAYLRSLNDDKQYYAEQQLSELYFEEQPFFATSLYGDADTIAGLDAKSLLADYQQLLSRDQIQITIAGDVDEAAVVHALSQWPLDDRTESAMPLIYKREQQPVRRLTEVQPLQQSKLNLAYRLPIYYREQGFYDAIVFNGLFGGTPISMLFKNVREKNSLAYYASSRFDGFTGTLLVQTGIDQRNQAAVEEIIAAQLQAISQGEFSDELFNQVVASLINGRESRQDSQRALVNQAMLNQLVRKNVSAAEWVAAIQRVTPKDVAQVAQRVEQQAVFFLKGEASK